MGRVFETETRCMNKHPLRTLVKESVGTVKFANGELAFYNGAGEKTGAAVLTKRQVDQLIAELAAEGRYMKS